MGGELEISGNMTRIITGCCVCVCFEQSLQDVSTTPGQQPGFSWREVSFRRQQSSQSAPRGSIARPLSAPPDTLPDVTSLLPSYGDADAVKAAGAMNDAADHAP